MISISLNISLISMGGADGIIRPNSVPSALVLRTFNSCTSFLFNSITFNSITFNSLVRSVPSHVINFSDSTGICSDSITSSNILLPALNSSEEIS